MVQTIGLDTRNKKLVHTFLELPFRIYRNTPQWVPPMMTDVSRMLDRQKHPYYKHSDAAFFLAMNGDQAVGRIAVLDNRNFNSHNHEQTAFFFLYECDDNIDASHALFDAAFAWAKQHNLNKIVGPRGFMALDGLGMLVEGFEHRPAFGIAYNPPYYAKQVEAAGFTKEGEIKSGYIGTSTPFPAKIDELAELVKRRRGLTILRFKTRKEVRRSIYLLRELYNQSLAGSDGGIPLTNEEVDSMASQLEWFADPRLVKIVMKGDEPVGFLLAYPDISAAVQRSRGRLLPFGWADMLIELRRTKWININGAGISEKYRGMGGTAILFSEMRKSVVESGYLHADIVQIGVENEKMQREMREFGIDFYKTHRMYQRAL